MGSKQPRRRRNQQCRIIVSRPTPNEHPIESVFETVAQHGVHFAVVRVARIFGSRLGFQPSICSYFPQTDSMAASTGFRRSSSQFKSPVQMPTADSGTWRAVDCKRLSFLAPAWPAAYFPYDPCQSRIPSGWW
jgi:hypothetical protein